MDIIGNAEKSCKYICSYFVAIMLGPNNGLGDEGIILCLNLYL